ncbi:chlorophyllase-1-like [Coffea eugenioides]|uniref:Chlorophyllase-1-like n=1 Tax=Coffea arabica TaxID=13443 RepID=A0A6P6V0C6_COFAR|nr:chlorophyllase-1-like [Coffea arabica]XP_027165225.1 chlorophyllase-1-like [Coffea eugenioides]
MAAAVVVPESMPTSKAMKVSSVFEEGNLSVKSFPVESSAVSSKSRPLLVFTPTELNTYPVILFIHGFLCSNTSYRQLLQHVATHGFIVVAPQTNPGIFATVSQEITDAAEVTKWMATELQALLPDNVTADVDNLGVAGHGRGGYVAFCLALGKAETTLNFKALIGIDPVAGVNTLWRSKPDILTYIPRSFDLEIPVGVIGTGLGSQKKNFLLPPCAPEGVNHAEFFNECKPPCCYFLAKEYGHTGMLDDGAAKLGNCACKRGSQPRYLMRKAVAGIVVAFMESYLKNNESDLLAVINNPKSAPITLDPVIYVNA